MLTYERVTESHRAGLTLIEVAIVLVLIGLLMGIGAGLVGSLTKRVKIHETRETIDSAVESILGFAVAMKRLPNETEFESILRKTHDSWNKKLRYVVWSNFTFNETNVICPTNATPHGFRIQVGNRTIDNVAFLIISSGPNYNLQTKFENGSHVVWYVNDNTRNNTGIIIYSPGTENIDDHPYDVNRQEEYDDIVKWVTVYELMQKACHGEAQGDQGPLRIITYSLPIATQKEPYNASIVAVGGVPPYTWSDSWSGGVKPPGLNFLPSNGSEYTLSGVPECSRTYTLNVTVRDNRTNTVSRTFTLSVQPRPLGLSPSPGTTWYATNGTYFGPVTITPFGGSGSYTLNTCYPTSCYGLSLSCLNHSATINGTPNATGTCHFNVGWKDSCNATISGTYTVVINP